MARTALWGAAAFTVAVAVTALAGQRLKAQAIPPAAPPPAAIAGSAVAISTADQTISGWFLEPPSPRGAILLIQGVRSDRTEMQHRIRLFRDAGYAVLVIDVADNGESLLPRVSFGQAERQFQHAALAWLRARLPNSRISVVSM
jgi:uncharacterized protein